MSRQRRFRKKQPVLSHTRSLRVEHLEDRWLLSGVPGDFNGNDMVDTADFTTWRDRLGSHAPLTNDGGLGVPVGQAHYELWKSNYGLIAPYWKQFGTEMDGEAISDRSGSSVSMSSDGTTVAIGVPGNEDLAGLAQVYRYDFGTGVWNQHGPDIHGNAVGDQFGSSIALSSDGSTVAIGAPGNADVAGHTQVYRYDSGTGTWDQFGADMEGETDDDQFGSSVALSADGNTVAIGAPGNDNNGELAGHTRIYRYDF
ncbi:MAG: FG-GAP repeat protein, partial [Pirellulaceae bacterium]|nr:FG-GAP repeat protein [Pirellulaceae bacterium]